MAHSTSLSIVNDILKSIDDNYDVSDQKTQSSSSSSVPPSRHFLNTYTDCINDCIDGTFISSLNNNITRLFTNDKSIKVVLRSDWDKSKVALVSGGGSGHEPSHAGYVGKGMLTAAVCGEIFASPPTKSVVAAIKAVCGDSGTLLIIKNYTGDVLCFKLAAQIAKEKYNFNVEYVIVGDDVAIGKKQAGRVGRRGIAGTVLVHKIAGYLAEKGESLINIKTYLEKNILPNLGSIGLAATSCYLPGSSMIKKERIKISELELGLGIHGESGAQTIKFNKIPNIITNMFNLLFDKSSDRNYISFLNDNKLLSKKQRIIILLNNLGGTTPIEMGIIMKYILKYLDDNNNTKHYVIERIFNGSYMTSLDMKGFSISILKVNDQILNALDCIVDPVAWIKGYKIDIKTLLHGGQSVDDQKDDNALQQQQQNISDLTDNGAKLLKTYIENVCEAIASSKKELNDIDVIVGDGDCGSTLDVGRSILMNNISSFNFQSIYLTLRKIGVLLSDMGGSSGALYGYLFISASKRYKECCGINGSKLNGLNIANAFKYAIQDLSDYSGAKPTNRTMIDALYPAVNALYDYYKNKKNDQNNHINAIKLAADAAKNGADATKTMTPAFGRSVYISMDILKDVCDPGAVAVSIWINALTK